MRPLDDAGMAVLAHLAGYLVGRLPDTAGPTRHNAGIMQKCRRYAGATGGSRLPPVFLALDRCSPLRSSVLPLRTFVDMNDD